MKCFKSNNKFEGTNCRDLRLVECPSNSFSYELYFQKVQESYVVATVKNHYEKYLYVIYGTLNSFQSLFCMRLGRWLQPQYYCQQRNHLFNALLVLRSLVCINQHACLNMITYPRIKKRSTKGAKTKIVSLFDRNFIFFA